MYLLPPQQYVNVSKLFESCFVIYQLICPVLGFHTHQSIVTVYHSKTLLTFNSKTI